jgi:acyl-CoA synthetase (AMP-forming)/AMP-acid ligase II
MTSARVAPRARARERGGERVWRTELSPVSFLGRAAVVHADAPALVHGPRRLTYRELGERVARLASALRGVGLEDGDRVAVLAPNTPAMVEAHFAVPAAGGILVCINIRQSPGEVAALLEHSEPRVILVDAEYEELLSAFDASAAEVVRIDDTGAPDDPYERLVASGSPDHRLDGPADEEDAIAINYTSGTTGEPKGVTYTHRGAYLNALANVIEAGLTPRSRLLLVAPLFHCNGWCFAWGAVAVGATLICLRRADPADMWQLIDEEGVTHFNSAPTVEIALVNHPAAHRVPSGLTASTGGSPPSPTLLGRMRELNITPHHLYGLTETYAPITRCLDARLDGLPDDDLARLLARQGQAHVTADLVRVVDEEMNDVPRDGETPGEVVMRGNIVMRGYFRDPAATAQAFRGGWFHSGDVAVWHPSGAIELRDRMKDIIISGGENISTIEVEQMVMRHPAVLECAVVSMPDAYWGERPVAYVTARPGMDVDEADVIGFCRERMAHYKCPAAVRVGELPKTSTGKVQKFLLRGHEWAGHERRIN